MLFALREDTSSWAQKLTFSAWKDFRAVVEAAGV
jgi:hypothetical protein